MRNIQSPQNVDDEPARAARWAARAGEEETFWGLFKKCQAFFDILMLSKFSKKPEEQNRSQNDFPAFFTRNLTY